MKLKEFIEAQYSVDTDYFGVVMPLTTGFEIKDPKDVIGFAWRTVGNSDIHVVTLPDREWETSAKWTGLNADLYSDSLVEKITDCGGFMNMVDNPVFAFARGILVKSLEMLDIRGTVIELPRAVAALHNSWGVIPAEVDSLLKTVRWLNSGTPLRKMKRSEYVTNMKLWPQESEGYPVMGWNLDTDACMAIRILDNEVEQAEDESDDLK